MANAPEHTTISDEELLSDTGDFGRTGSWEAVPLPSRAGVSTGVFCPAADGSVRGRHPD